MAAQLVGTGGRVVGVDMTDEMLAKSRATAEAMELDHVEFRRGIAGGLSVDGWREVMANAGFVAIEVGPAVDAFDGAPGEPNARQFDVWAHAFSARTPG